MTRPTASQPTAPARSRTERPAREDPANARFLPDDSVRIPVPVPRAVARQWITKSEAARHLGVGIDKISEGMRSGGLKYSRLGRSTIRLRREWVDAWAETLTRQTS